METYELIERLLDPTPLTRDEAVAQLEASRVDLQFVAFKHPLYIGPDYGPQLEAVAATLDGPLADALPAEHRESLEHMRRSFNTPDGLVAKHAFFHEKLAATGDWIPGVQFLIERPFRPDVALVMLDRSPIADRDEARRFLADLWTDTEFPSGNNAWMAIWERLRPIAGTPFGDLVDELEDVVTVYRGFAGEPDEDDGLSWTLDYDRAEWFARRFAHFHDGVCGVWEGTVRREDVWMATDERGEREVIAQLVTVKALDELELETRETTDA